MGYCPYCRATAGCTCRYGTRVLFGAVPTIAPPEQGKHWFVPDESGYYCVACNLPPGNSRHAARES